MKIEPADGVGIVTAFRDGEVTLRTNRRVDGYTFAIKETDIKQFEKVILSLIQWMHLLVQLESLILMGNALENMLFVPFSG